MRDSREVPASHADVHSIRTIARARRVAATMALSVLCLAAGVFDASAERVTLGGVEFEATTQYSRASYLRVGSPRFFKHHVPFSREHWIEVVTPLLPELERRMGLDQHGLRLALDLLSVGTEQDGLDYSITYIPSLGDVFLVPGWVRFAFDPEGRVHALETVVIDWPRPEDWPKPHWMRSAEVQARAVAVMKRPWSGKVHVNRKVVQHDETEGLMAYHQLLLGHAAPRNSPSTWIVHITPTGRVLANQSTLIH